jgi:NACHT domain
VDGTNTWFLEHSSVEEWIDPSLPAHSSRLLWAYGKPGCGKSMLASSIVLHLQKSGSRTIYFFSNSKLGNAVKSSPLGLVRTLLAQLLDDDTQLFDSLFAEYTKSSTETASSIDALWEIFRLWCDKQLKPIFCVIDALDEAMEE